MIIKNNLLLLSLIKLFRLIMFIPIKKCLLDDLIHILEKMFANKLEEKDNRTLASILW